MLTQDLSVLWWVFCLCGDQWWVCLVKRGRAGLLPGDLSSERLPFSGPSGHSRLHSVPRGGGHSCFADRMQTDFWLATVNRFLRRCLAPLFNTALGSIWPPSGAQPFLWPWWEDSFAEPAVVVRLVSDEGRPWWLWTSCKGVRSRTLFLWKIKESKFTVQPWKLECGEEPGTSCGLAAPEGMAYSFRDFFFPGHYPLRSRVTLGAVVSAFAYILLMIVPKCVLNVFLLSWLWCPCGQTRACRSLASLLLFSTLHVCGSARQNAAFDLRDPPLLQDLGSRFFFTWYSVYHFGYILFSRWLYELDEQFKASLSLTCPWRMKSRITVDLQKTEVLHNDDSFKLCCKYFVTECGFL